MTLSFISCSGCFSQSNGRKKANGKTNTKCLHMSDSVVLTDTESDFNMLPTKRNT